MAMRAGKWKWKRERERDGSGRNNVAFVRARNSGHIEHPAMTRWERPDEQ